MPVSPTYPGVYVQEVPSGVRTITGVATSTTLFVGSSSDGPVNEPRLCLKYTEFARTFSEDLLGDHHLPRYLRLFFQNGGTQAWVMRIAHGYASSAISLLAEGTPGAPGPAVLALQARSPGVRGDSIRAVVDYNTDQPESTFNLEVFRWATDSSGAPMREGGELWRNLSMDPGSSLYAVDVISQQSKLVTASLLGGPLTPLNGVSLGMYPVVYDATNLADFFAQWKKVLGATAPANSGRKFQVSVGGRAYVTVDLSAIDVRTFASKATLQAAIKTAVLDAYTRANAPIPAGDIDVSFVDAATPNPAQTPSLLELVGNAKDVTVVAAADNDLALPLMLGAAQGGVEVSSYGAYRPAANGYSYALSTGGANPAAAVRPLFGLTYADVATLTLDGQAIAPPRPPGMAPTDALYMSDHAGGRKGLRNWLLALAGGVNAAAAVAPPNAPFPWRAGVWGYRLALLRTAGVDNAVAAAGPTSAASATLGNGFIANVRAYSLGTSGAGSYQTGGAGGHDGTAPQPADYDAAYQIADREIDLFNLLCLPPDKTGDDMTSLWGPASSFCQKRRAFLLMDPPGSWVDVQTAQLHVADLRIGLVKDYAAVFYPRLTVLEDGRQQQVGPAAAIAGLMARIDGSRGVWKASAGVEADVRGIVGVERRFSDDENGVLNPKAINTVRVFPNGIVNWGARTMDGDDAFQSDYKYIPVRRLALFIEESLYRGLKWVVFEPNDEPLWAQIRLNVGSFMNSLFRKGAFQGAKPADAYFVRCSAETTLPDDRNRGIVNIWVGFAPLKPAEFVILYLQQMAGQIQA